MIGRLLRTSRSQKLRQPAVYPFGSASPSVAKFDFRGTVERLQVSG